MKCYYWIYLGKEKDINVSGLGQSLFKISLTRFFFNKKTRLHSTQSVDSRVCYLLKLGWGDIKIFKCAPFADIVPENIAGAQELINPKSIEMTTVQALEDTSQTLKTVTGCIVQVS